MPCGAAASQYKAAYHAARREEHAELRAAYLASHREEEAARGAKYYAAHREEIAARTAAHSAAHREERREEKRAYQAAYCAAHREEKRAYIRNRRARKRGNGGTHTAEDIQAQYERQQGICFWCPEKVGDTYHVDHVVPVILGGSNGPENLVIACPFCNRSKAGKHPMDFAGVLC